MCGRERRSREGRSKRRPLSRLLRRPALVSFYRGRLSNDLRDVGDVRHLSGRTVEIRSALKLCDSRSEIILNRISQIKGGAAMIPPLPKTYDVENHGHFSAGRLRPTKKPKKTKAKPNPTVTYGNDVEGSDREE